MGRFGKPYPIEFSTPLGATLADMRRGDSEYIGAFFDRDDPLDAVATSFDLDTVRMADVRAVVRDLLKGTQKSLRHRGLPPTLLVYRYGDINYDFPVTSVTLDKYVAMQGAERHPPALVFTINRRDVLVDVNAVWPYGKFAEEEELIVKPEDLVLKGRLSGIEHVPWLRESYGKPVPWWGDIRRGPGRELEMRWARWAVRHFGRYLPSSDAPKHPLVKNGKPTPQALQAERWGAPIPKTIADAQKIARRGYAVLKKWRD